MGSEFVQVLLNNGAGMAALLFVFWMLYKELPEQRISRDKMLEKFSDEAAKGRALFTTEADKARASTEVIVKEFRSELSMERHECAQERTLDRQARHATANSLNGVTMALLLIADKDPEQGEALRKIVKTITSSAENVQV